MAAVKVGRLSFLFFSFLSITFQFSIPFFFYFFVVIVVVKGNKRKRKGYRRGKISNQLLIFLFFLGSGEGQGV